jgi:glycosyltransferase involved in cell wall biosynthesis
MNILYIANPASIHDTRWINFFAAKQQVRCFVIVRKWHLRDLPHGRSGFNEKVSIVQFIDDPSTIRFWRNWLVIYKIWKAVRVYKIEAIHILYAEPNALWAQWKWIFRVPMIVSTRGTDVLRTIPEFFSRKRFLDRRVAKNYLRAFKNANRITCTSTIQIESLSRMGIPSSKTSLVRTGVDFSLLHNAGKDTATRYRVEKPFVLMPRKMSGIYDHNFTLDAIALLDPWIRDRYNFVFVNSDTNEQAYFQTIQARSRAMAARIQFLPTVPQQDLFGLFLECSLVVMNPRSDGSPVSAMEAMACKAPVVLPPLDYDEVVFAHAFSFDEWTPNSLKEKITEVLNMPSELIASHSEKNWTAVYKHGNMESELTGLFNLYFQMAIGGQIVP